MTKKPEPSKPRPGGGGEVYHSDRGQGTSKRRASKSGGFKYRSAVTGRYVSTKHATANPRTTVKETGDGTKSDKRSGRKK
jgi:hypothetical protein